MLDGRAVGVRRHRVSAGDWPDLPRSRRDCRQGGEVWETGGSRELGAHLLLEQLASPSPSPEGRILLEISQLFLGDLADRFQLVEPSDDVGSEFIDVAVEFGCRAR